MDIFLGEGVLPKTYKDLLSLNSTTIDVRTWECSPIQQHRKIWAYCITNVAYRNLGFGRFVVREGDQNENVQTNILEQIDTFAAP